MSTMQGLGRAAVLLALTMLSLGLSGCDRSDQSESADSSQPSQPPVDQPPQPVPGMSSNTFSLSQGWNTETRQKFWFTGQGSQVAPRSWMLAIEQAGSTERFASAATFEKFRYLPMSPTPPNPDGWPLGFAISKDPVSGEEWFGYTCSGCHTGRLDYGGKTLILDGGATMADLIGFIEGFLGAVSATLQDPAKLARFNEKVLGAGYGGPAAAQLKSELIALAASLDARRFELVPSGYGRLDAFGTIFNEVLGDNLGIPNNQRIADAPVSYPFLWDASHTSLVQWNGAVPNSFPMPLGRNVAEMVGVFGQIDIDRTRKGGYQSSIEMKNLGDLEEWLKQLWSPQWPEEILPALDQAKVASGKAHYQQHCASCHAVIDRTDPKRKIDAVMTPVKDVGTDPRTAMNFAQRMAKSGRLQGAKTFYLVGDPLGAEAKGMDILMNVVVGTIVGDLEQGIEAAIEDYEGFYRTHGYNPFTNPSYKARPLNGAWATAPYLHNGSVPNLWELLLPPAQRSRTFYVGSYKFDPVKVGFDTGPSESATTTQFNADDPTAGNSNGGHVYGTAELSEAQKWELIEYLKSL